MRYRIFLVIACLLTSIFCTAQLAFTKQTDSRPELSSSGVTVNSRPSDQQKENLFVVAKTWGFLKYYHRDVAKGTYNFDSCLFNILPSALRVEQVRMKCILGKTHQ